MKKVMQRVVILSALGCWTLVAITAKHHQPLKCRQEWKAGFVNTASDNKEKFAADMECGNPEAGLKNESLLPGRAMQFLLQ